MMQSDHLFLEIAIILGTQWPWACQCWWWIGTAMKADMLPSALHWCLRSISWTLGWCRCQRASAVARFLDDVAAAVPSEGSSSPERSPLSMIEAASFAGSDAHVVPFPHPPPHPNPIVNHDEGAALVWWGCSACVRAGTWTLLPHPTPPQNPKRQLCRRWGGNGVPNPWKVQAFAGLCRRWGENGVADEWKSGVFGVKSEGDLVSQMRGLPYCSRPAITMKVSDSY